jgi:hypothetical protein
MIDELYLEVNTVNLKESKRPQKSDSALGLNLTQTDSFRVVLTLLKFREWTTLEKIGQNSNNNADYSIV